MPVGDGSVEEVSLELDGPVGGGSVKEGVSLELDSGCDTGVAVEFTDLLSPDECHQYTWPVDIRLLPQIRELQRRTRVHRS